MATFDNNTVTLEGRKLLMNSLVNGVGIEFTHFAIGDGAPPDAPENQTALVNQLFTVEVTKTQPSDTEKGVTLVRGRLTNDAGKGDFYWRELGLYARTAGTEEEPILFGYTNTGETADYVPHVNVGSKVVIAILLQIVTGSAKVLYVADPTATATIQDMEELKADVEARLSSFSEESLSDIEKQIANLQEAIDDAIKRLADAADGYVKKTGDTMTGDLTIQAGFHLIGDIQGNGQGYWNGSAAKWEGWRLFSSLEGVNNAQGTNLNENTSMLAIGEAMPDRSRLIHAISTEGATVSENCFPAKFGLLEIVKFSNYRCAYTFTSIEGHRWHAAIHTYDPKWKGWTFSESAPVGTVEMFAGATTPMGYLFCKGQSLSTTSYAALFAVIGYRYGGSGNNFNLPDFRGVFPRGFDDGRGIDSGRVLGTKQESAAPNITGKIHVGYSTVASGAFAHAEQNWDGTGGGTTNACRNATFDASRSSSVYQSGVKEVRPVNLAINFIIKY